MSLRRRYGRRAALVALAVYALVLVAAPVLHHDLACHLKTVTHCGACLSTPMASQVESASPIDAAVLTPADRIVPRAARAAHRSAVPALPPRAPPA